MGRSNDVVNVGYENTENIIVDSGSHTRILIKEEFSFTPKSHHFLGELPKENSFTSTSSASESDTYDEGKTSASHSVCGEFYKFFLGPFWLV